MSDDREEPMTSCRICGVEFRDGDDVIMVAYEALHAGCAEPHKPAKRRKIGAWASMGSGGQMALGDVQRETPG